ncbi:zinc finger protein 266-like isoform X2 [Maniola hyperantus]|uniref:zinc finger protein 266-like isoform X2 n=1 Tax=Aphantopus hyperantus TaxID=2795564 RepID=UPI00374A7277
MVCQGCLSVDRKLTVVDDEVLKIYLSFLDTEYCNNFVQLCWECRALFKRLLRFRRQVRCAHTILVRYLIPQSKSLSTLQTTECNNIIEVDHDTTFPTTFVKIEDDSADDDDLGDEHDVGFNDDLMELHVEGVEIKTDIKCDPILEVPAPERSKSRTRSKPSNVFHESDDEPLSKGDRTKPRGRRRNKSEGERGKKGRKRKASPGVVNNAMVQNKLQKLNADAEHLEMVVLSWDEVEAERQKAVRSHVFLRHEHRCYSCVVGFNHRCKLDDHNSKKHDPSYGTEECSVCRVRLKNSCALKAHRRRHISRWRCRFCGDVWSRAEVAADHVARVHGGNTPVHTCSACGHTETLGRLRNHIKTHSEKQKCEVCGKMFRNKDSLRTHLFIHKGEKEHACPRCDKMFLFKKAMELHLISHDASAQLYCHECDMNFKNKMSFNQHMKYNLKHVDPAKLKHACTLCDKKFVKAIRLEEHNLAVHLKMTPINCTEQGCHFACSSKPVLRTHVRMLHRNARAKRDHVCDVCGKAYSTKKSLEGHLRSHSGERPFRCVSCPAAFGYQAALYNHNKLVHLKLNSGGGRGRGAAPAWAGAALPAAPSLDTTSPHTSTTTLL